MKTPLAVLVGAVLGGAATFAYLKSNPPGEGDAEETRKQLAEVRFDLDASKKAETRLRERVAELTRSADASNQQLVAGADARKDAKLDEPDKAEADKGGNVFAEMMRDFGKAQSDLAFNTLVDRLGLEGAQLEAFKTVFEATRAKRQAAYGKFATGGLTLEDLAMMDGYSPAIDEWVGANLDAAAQAEYGDFKEAQDLTRVERKANEELTWLSAITNLNADQKDAAFDIFAAHQTRERPEDILEIDSMEKFEKEAATGMNSRAEALAEVLDESQLEAYQEQSKVMLKMFEGILRNAIEGE